MGKSYNLILPHRSFLYPKRIIVDHITKVINVKKATFTITIPKENVNKRGDTILIGKKITRKLKSI